MIDIKILKSDEIEKSRTLYEEAFFEDSKKFVDYFYEVEAKENIVFGLKDENKIITMLHLHKFNVEYQDEKFETYYIVAVATLKEYKRRGYFRKNLVEALNFSYRQDIPFVFLMPANEQIYLPFMFATVVKLSVKKINAIKKSLIFTYVSDPKLLEKYLKTNKKIEIIKDEKYINKQIKGLLAQNGGYILVKQDDMEIAVLRYTSEADKISVLDIKDIKELSDEMRYEILGEFANHMNVDSIEYEFNMAVDKNEEDIKYMYRIVNLKKFLKLLKPKISKFDIKIKLVDNCIEENNGIYRIYIADNKYNIDVINNFDMEIGIDELLELLIKTSDLDSIPFIHEII